MRSTETQNLLKSAVDNEVQPKLFFFSAYGCLLKSSVHV